MIPPMLGIATRPSITIANATAAGGASIASPYAYGMSDLNYYGNFMTVPGFGNVWQPYFIGSNWSPFQDGGFAFYPGAGYMFVSGYPWDGCPTTTAPGPTLPSTDGSGSPAIGIPGTRCQWW